VGAVRIGVVIVAGIVLFWRVRHRVRIVDALRATVDSRLSRWQGSSARVLLRTE
jgi:hypothetical protein